MKRAYVAGEALIDLINVGGSRSAHVGGGPANTAKALARLGFSSVFVGGISSDEYGSLIETELVESGVDLSAVHRSTLPTALARAEIQENGSAKYEFELADTATFAFSSDWLPSDSVEVVHVGSVATLVEPGASELFKWVSDLDSVVVFDPNVRPSIQGDASVYQAAVEKWISVAGVVKLSDDDLNWLYTESEEEIVGTWISSGVSLVVVTLGAAGLRAYFGGDVLEVPGASITLVDTVGAGDTIGAVLVEGILKHGLDKLMNREVVDSVLKRAVKAAGITCSRAGANPPWKEEL
ncbi:MAG: carbohydrate kinase [Candidatus Nanopelagicaceae bacterium]|nr:carbohydrate kinase [Candidatus Nanopelagicaceae bacterium]